MKSVMKLSVTLLVPALYLILAAVSLPATANAGQQCTENSTYNLHTGPNTSEAGGADGYCSLDPISMLLTFYEFGLCTGPSSPSDKSSCISVFSSSEGRKVDLSVGFSGQLNSEVSLPEGTFTNAYVILSNETSLKASQQFASSRTDADGGTGVHCFTNGLSIDDGDDIITCAGSPDPQHSIETISLGWLTYSNMVLDYEAVIDGTTTITDLYMINSSGALSSDGQDFAIYADQTLAEPITISPTSQNIDLGISVTNGASLGFYENGDSGCADVNGCLGDALFNGMKILVTSN